ncbi:MAG: PAS domain S-box protein [Bacteroidota bacterium]
MPHLSSNSLTRLWGSYKRSVRRVVLPDSDVRSKTISYWRNEIFLNILVFISPLSIIALVPSVYMSFANNLLVVGIADLFVFALIIMIMFRRNMSLNLRKTIFIAIIFGLSVILLYYLPRPGPGLIFLLVITVFSAVIYSPKAAFYSACANTVVCCVFAGLLYLRLDIPITAEYTVGSWIAISSNLVFLSFVCAQCLNLLLRGLEFSLDDSRKLTSNLTSIINSTDSRIYSLDTNFRFITFNEPLKNALKLNWGVGVKPGDHAFSFLENVSTEEFNFWEGVYTEAMTGKTMRFERDFDFGTLHTTTDFSLCPIIDKGSIAGISCFASDITDLKRARLEVQELNEGLERKVAERTTELVFINRELMEVKEEIHSQNDILEQRIIQRTTQYAFMSQINQSIVHIKDEQSLLRNACLIAIKTGNFEMAWIGMFDADYKTLSLSAQQGMAPEQVDAFRDVISKINGPEANVLKSNSYFICNDIEKDFDLEIGKSFSIEHDIHSCMVLPIRKFTKIVGVFSFYARERHFFRPEEVALLAEVAGDISFALENFEKESRHKATEDLVIKNEKRFRSLVENGADAIFILSEDGRYNYVSPSVEQVLGYSEQQAMKSEMFALIHPEDLTKARKAWAQTLSAPAVAIRGLICRMQHQDNSWRWIECTFTNMLHDASLRGIVNNFRDVTERIKVKTQLSNTAVALAGALSDLQKIMDASLDIICSIDEAGKFVKVSKACESILGFKPEDMLGQKYIDLVVKDDIESTSKVAEQVMNGIPATSFENRCLHKNGSVVPILWSATWDANDRLMYCIAKDNTERKKDDAERLGLIEGLQAKNNDLQQFSYIVSHNLRAPIANILGLTSIIDKESTQNSFLLNKLTAETSKLDEVVKDINVVVSARKLEHDKFQNVRFESKLTSIVQVLDTEIIESGASITTDFRPAETIWTIKSYLYSILYNLVSNAIKYRRPDTQLRIEIATTKDDKVICLSVKDNGIGIDLAKNGTKLFGMYKRFHAGAIPGKGIGLNLVKTHVETLGGRMEVESEIDKGTTFRVFLPKNYETNNAA